MGIHICKGYSWFFSQRHCKGKENSFNKARLRAERKSFALSFVLPFLTCETQAFRVSGNLDFGGLSHYLKNGDVFLMDAFER
ncbi:MAG: hypothetical protein V8Q17_04915 [Acutalibacteraceae bacterium]